MENEQNKMNPEFSIQRIYIKDLSLECPNSPHMFRVEWKPDVNLQINVDTNRLEEDFFHVIVKVTVTVKNKDQDQEKVAFLIEVQQAGIFLLRHFSDEQRRHMLGAFCPNILFPYVRELVSEMATRAGYPPLYLAPVNFDAIYMEQMRQNPAVESEETGSKIIH